MEPNYELTNSYFSLLDTIKFILTRQNLCNNTYLFKSMKNNLTLPLYVFLEERKITYITNNQEQITKALRQSCLAKVNGKQVTLIDFPTIRIATKNNAIIKQIERLLILKQKKFKITPKAENQMTIITLFEENSTLLEELVTSLDKEVQFEKASLYEDMKQGVSRIKKLKLEQKNNVGTKYSFDKPPPIFIRKAIESEEDDEVKQKPRQKKKQYKESTKEVTKESMKESIKEYKPKFTNEDFPSLN